ncbi:MAG: DUF4832 domain-containing protein, partial [Myxococcota bacterium]
ADASESTWVDPPTKTIELARETATLLNPERGFHRFVNLGDDLEAVRAGGDTLAFTYLRLDPYRESDVPASFIERLDAHFENARAAGVKIVPRFAYNEGPYPQSEPDASRSRVLRHITQLTPTLRNNADVIAVFQAGFIGAWGEWHSSTEGLLDDPDTKYEILDALLDALPPSRSVQLRYPRHKRDRYGEPLAPVEANDGADASRVGHHNDCFLASDTDMGTYSPGDRASWLTYLGAETRYVPMGGETCAVYPPLTLCGSALDELESLHFSYINRDYHPEVVERWRRDGCFDEIYDKLGYRLAVTELTYPEVVRPGGVLPLRIAIRNEGWAAPMNRRAVVLWLRGEEKSESVVIPTDIRRWMALDTTVLELRVQVPATFVPGRYDLALALPDPEPRLADDPRYAVRLANRDVWHHGVNVLASIRLDEDAPGSSNPDATGLVLIE